MQEGESIDTRYTRGILFKETRVEECKSNSWYLPFDELRM